MNPSHRPDKFVLQVARTVLAEAAQKPWLASLLAQQKDWLEKLRAHIQRLTRPQRLGLRRKLASGMAAAVLLASLVGAPQPGLAAGAITVDGDGTLGTCSLSDAIITANSGLDTGNCTGGTAGADVISVTTYVNLLTPLPTISSEITIDGYSAMAVNNQYSIGATGFTILTVDPSASLTLKNTFISGGGDTTTLGGGIYNNGYLKVVNCLINSNTAMYGGGILNNKTAVVSNTTISYNSATNGGGIMNNGTLTVQNSNISSNYATTDDGGGIYSTKSPLTSLTILSSTFSKNSAAKYGGGIYANSDTMSIDNSTFYDNSASYGGGLYISRDSGTNSIQNSTITNNSATTSGGGIYAGAGVSLKNTIIALQKTSNDCKATPGGFINSLGYNIDSDSSCNLIEVTDMPGKNSGDLDLDVLANSGGPTSTVRLLSASVAIDAIPDGTNGCKSGTDATASVDQRGAVRASGVNRGGNACDIGAYEYNSSQNPSVVALKSFTAAAHPAQGLLVGLAAAAGSALAGLAYYVTRRLDRQKNS